jgi:hypothetical protein
MLTDKSHFHLLVLMNGRHGVKYVQTSAGNYWVNPWLLPHHLFLMYFHDYVNPSIRNCFNEYDVLRSHEKLWAVHRVSEARGTESPSCSHARLDDLHIDFYTRNIMRSSRTESYGINISSFCHIRKKGHRKYSSVSDCKKESSEESRAFSGHQQCKRVCLVTHILGTAACLEETVWHS